MSNSTFTHIAPARDATTRGGYGLLCDAMILSAWEIVRGPITWRRAGGGIILDGQDYRNARALLTTLRWRPSIERAVARALARRRTAYRAVMAAAMTEARAEGVIAGAEAHSSFLRVLRRENAKLAAEFARHGIANPSGMLGKRRPAGVGTAG